MQLGDGVGGRRRTRPPRGVDRLSAVDFTEVVRNITPLTKVGVVCLIAGKTTGIVTVPFIMVPSLNIYAVPMLVLYGGLVLAAIVVCTLDYYVFNPPEKTLDRKIAELRTLLTENPELRRELLDDTEIAHLPSRTERRREVVAFRH